MQKEEKNGGKLVTEDFRFNDSFDPAPLPESGLFTD
jgi:hypothetical protein